MGSIATDAIKIPKKIMKITGHWPEESPSKLVKLSGIVSWTISIVFVITLLMELAKHFDDYELLSEQLSITAPPTSFLIKLILCRKERKQFLKLLQQLNLDVFNKYPKEYELIAKEYIQTSTFVGNLYQGMCCLVVTLYSVTPFFTKMGMPVRWSYELGSFKYVMYAFQVIGLVNAALNNSCIDVLATDLMSIATAQISILNKKIVDFKCSNGVNKYKQNIEKKMYTDNLKECVKHHNEIIRYIENFESVFSFVFLVQYLSSGIVICNIGFQVVHTTPLSIRFAQMIFFFASMMCELGMYSWFGNEIIVKSGAIKNACYESDWINCDLETQRTLIMITENSKKPLFLTAGKFTALSLASFATVVKTSYSYFALMQRLYRDTQN